MRPRLAAALLLLSVAGCGGRSHAHHIESMPPPPPPPAGPPAPLRVIHASPDPTVAHVALRIDERPVTDDLAFGAASGYRAVPAGSHSVAIRPSDLPAGTRSPLMETYHLVGPDASTLIVHGIVGGSPRLGFTFTTDTVDEPDGGRSRVRFFHAAVGLGPVEVCAGGRGAHHASPVFAAGDEGSFLPSATQGAVGPWTELSAAAGVTLRLRVPDEGHPCHGMELGSVTLDVPSGERLTLVAIGRMDADPAVEPAVLVCPDGGEEAQCTRVPVETGR